MFYFLHFVLQVRVLKPGRYLLLIVEQLFLQQAGEEQLHALKLLSYVQKAGGSVKLGAIDAPPHEYASVFDVVQQTLEHERKVTRMIHDLVAQAEQDKDYSTRSYLQWFVDEQVEEEASFTELLQLTKLAGDNFLMLEHRVELLVQARMAAAAAAGPQG